MEKKMTKEEIDYWCTRFLDSHECCNHCHAYVLQEMNNNLSEDDIARILAGAPA